MPPFSTELSRRAVVTGATEGIGRAIAESLWQAGFDLAVCARTPSKLEDFARHLNDGRPDAQVLTQVCDVGDRAAVSAFAKTIHDVWPTGFNVLVNNAGVFVPGDLLGGEEGALQHLINVNLMGAYWLSRDLIAGLRQNSGRALIVNICSVAGLEAYPPSGPYTVSKFALRGLGAALRYELRDAGVAVTTIYPGPTESASWAGADVDFAHLMAAEDVAETVLSLTRLSARSVVEEVVMRPQHGEL